MAVLSSIILRACPAPATAHTHCRNRGPLCSLTSTLTGVVLWELCAGEHPMRGRNRPLRVPEDCPAEVADLYERCTAEDPAQRPTAREVVEQLTRLVVPPGAIDRQ